MQAGDLLTVPQAARRLGVTRQRVDALIKNGRVPVAEWRGPVRYLRAADLEAVRVRRPGRPWPVRNKGACVVVTERGVALLAQGGRMDVLDPRREGPCGACGQVLASHVDREPEREWVRDAMRAASRTRMPW